MPLGIAAYDDAERRAKQWLGFQEVLAFAPTAMAITGFPTNVDIERQIAAYMDWNDGDGGECLFTDPFIPVRALETRFTAQEIDLGCRASDRAAEVSRTLCGRAMRPISGLIAMFGLLRILKAMQAAAGLKQISVFEVGPGNGFLGALLALTGDRYCSIDNAQAFYLWQSRLLEASAPGEFHDWAEHGKPTADARIQHLPWWEYLGLRHGEPPHVDVFISNCNLQEMNRYALKYTTRIAARMVQGSPIGQFMFVAWGNPTHNTAELIEHELRRSGFERQLSRFCHSFGLTGTPGGKFTHLDERIPLYGDESSTVPTVELMAKMGLDRASLPFDIDFVKFLGFEKHFVDHPAFRRFI